MGDMCSVFFRSGKKRGVVFFFLKLSEGIFKVKLGDIGWCWLKFTRYMD